MATPLIKVEMAYATPEKQVVMTLWVKKGSTLLDVINASSVLSLFPEIDLTKQTVGVFNQRRQLNELVASGDRVEIYRELLIDPKESRRKKAKK